MFDETHNLEFSRKDLELIESALHTQHKILSVQSKAGGQNALERLTDVKHLMKRLDRQTLPRRQQTGTRWSQMARSLFC